MLKPNAVTVLFAVHCMHRVSGYNPSIGEIAKVAGLSYGVTNRALVSLCGDGLIRSHCNMRARVKYRFSDTLQGGIALKERGWTNGF